MTTPTWATRDLPVLIAAVELFDQLHIGGSYPDGADIAERSGLDINTVGTALHAVRGDYIDLQMTMGDPGGWFVQDIFPAARRAAGQWPAAESVIDKLAAALEHFEFTRAEIAAG